MKTKRRRQSGSPVPKLPAPPKPPKVPAFPNLGRGKRRKADVEDIQRKAFSETRQAEYDAPDDVLSELLSARILEQHPDIGKDDYPAFWISNFQLQPNEDDKAAVDHIRKLIAEMEKGS